MLQLFSEVNGTRKLLDFMLDNLAVIIMIIIMIIIIILIFTGCRLTPALPAVAAAGASGPQ